MAKDFHFMMCYFVFIVFVGFVLFLLIEESEPDQDMKGIFFLLSELPLCKCMALLNCLFCWPYKQPESFNSVKNNNA